MLHTFGPHEVGLKRHVEYPTLKHVENSLRGSRWAKRHHFKTNDLDMLPDEVLVKAVKAHPPILSEAAIAGHIPNTHWEDPFRRDGFRDPKRILHKGDNVSEMVPHEWHRIVAGWVPRYNIPSIEEQLALCGEIGLQALLEPKHGTVPEVWLRQEVWNYLARVADEHNCRTAVYSLFHKCLPFARNAGFTAWAI